MPDFDQKSAVPENQEKVQSQETSHDPDSDTQIRESRIGKDEEKPLLRAEVAQCIDSVPSQLDEKVLADPVPSVELMSIQEEIALSTDISADVQVSQRKEAVEALDKMIHEPGSDFESVEILLTTLAPEEARTLLALYQETKGALLTDILSKQFQRKDVELLIAVATDDRITESVLEIHQIVSQREISITQLKAVLESLDPAESQQVLAEYQKKYEQDLLELLDSKLPVSSSSEINTALYHPVTSTVHTLHDLLTQEQPSLQAITNILETTPASKLPAILENYSREYGHTLEAALHQQFQGSERFDSLIALLGQPKTLDEEVARIQARIDYEREITPPLTRQLLKRYHRGHDILEEERESIESFYEKVKDEDSPLPLPTLIPLYRAIDKTSASIPTVRLIRSSLADHMSGAIGMLFGLLIFWIFVRSERSFITSLSAGLVAFYFAQFTSRSIFEDRDNDGKEVVENLKKKEQSRHPAAGGRPSRRKRGRRSRRIHARFRPPST
jgi:hypothetical protein